ncbi:MAG TPA: hypothetical protein VGJ69_00385 [Pyrinomonadaceae bacterium]|jgi:hypothetical protein
MSNKKPQSKVVAETTPHEKASETTPPVIPEVVFDKSKGEISFTGPEGKTIALRATVIEEEPDEERSREPLTPEQFSEALAAVDRLGLTWTADLVPNLKAKSSETEAALASEELQELQDKYPHLPYEIHLAVTHALTGSKTVAQDAGGADWLDQKAKTVSEILIDNNYQSEFFFKYAIKIPYLKDIDWEIAFKAYERGVTKPLGVPYGVLVLTLQDPFFSGRNPKLSRTTVAVDETLVNELLSILNEVKSNLDKAKRLRDKLIEQRLLEEQDNADAKLQLEQ